MGKADYSEVALKIKALWTLTGPEIAKETLETYIKTFEGVCPTLQDSQKYKF